jgi:hypothetical protein
MRTIIRRENFPFRQVISPVESGLLLQLKNYNEKQGRPLGKEVREGKLLPTQVGKKAKII